MNTQAEVERIRARYQERYLSEGRNVMLKDIRTLLAILDAQQAVIDAAGAFVKADEACEDEDFGMVAWPGELVVTLNRLRSALEALVGMGEG